jgi:uncharacterized damage-inducible protein DinB
MKEYFLKLYKYNAWANNRVMKCLIAQNVKHSKILTLMSHILSAQLIWLARIQQSPTTGYHLWKERTPEELKRMTEEANSMWLEFVEKTDNFNKEMSYNNFKGLPFTNNIEQIMIHLVNHSTYHRAQIALLLRENGMEPVNTDFITYDRVITGQLND